MKQFGAFEAKNRLSELIALAEAGEEIVITRHGRPVARLVPATGRNPDDVRQAIEDIKTLRKQQPLGRFELKKLIEAGRKR